MEHVKQLAIIGTGLLGASVGLGLKQAGVCCRIVGIGRSQATLDRAAAVGSIDAGSTDLAQTIRDSQLVIIAVPLSGFESVFRELAPCQHDELVITDVGSTKVSVQAAADRWLANPAMFVGSHPMAGSEQQGPDAADGNLFQGKPCILTPLPTTDPRALRTAEALWTTLGMSLLQMTPEQHDQQVAVTSHLPHAAAVLLIQTAAALGGWDVASTGFRDTTRLAASNPPMRADIMLANREALTKALGEYRDQLDQLTALLEAGDAAAIVKLLEAAKATRADWLTQANL